MGDAAEMLLEGTLCEGCGEFLDGDTSGFPRRCAGCRSAPVRASKIRNALAFRITCPHCERSFRTAQGASYHARDKHGEPA